MKNNLQSYSPSILLKLVFKLLPFFFHFLYFYLIIMQKLTILVNSPEICGSDFMIEILELLEGA